jgi:hypothetical protein
VRAPLNGDGADDTSNFRLPTDPTDRRTVLGAQNVVATMHLAPVLIFVWGANVYPKAGPRIEWAYSAVYAAAQNMVVAAPRPWARSRVHDLPLRGRDRDPRDPADPRRSSPRRHDATGLAGSSVRPGDAPTRLRGHPL